MARPSRQAPSERHLEDYLWAHPEAFGELNLADHNNPAPHIVPKWRQVRISSGIVDMVGSYFDLGLAIIELKKGPIDTAAFAQLMRYMRDFRQMVSYLVSQYKQHKMPFADMMPGSLYDDLEYQQELLQGILVGSSISDRNLLIACHACNIEVFTYEFEGGEYLLTEDLSAIQENIDTYPGWTRDTPQTLTGDIVGYIHTRLELYHDEYERNRFDVIDAAERHLSTLDGES